MSLISLFLALLFQNEGSFVMLQDELGKVFSSRGKQDSRDTVFSYLLSCPESCAFT